MQQISKLFQSSEIHYKYNIIFFNGTLVATPKLSLSWNEWLPLIGSISNDPSGLHAPNMKHACLVAPSQALALPIYEISQIFCCDGKNTYLDVTSLQINKPHWLILPATERAGTRVSSWRNMMRGETHQGGHRKTGVWNLVQFNNQVWSTDQWINLAAVWTYTIKSKLIIEILELKMGFELP